MATLKITISETEKLQLLESVKMHKNKMVSVSTIAKAAGLNPNRSRFIMEELIEEGKVRKVIAKKFNDHFIRYFYEVVK